MALSRTTKTKEKLLEIQNKKLKIEKKRATAVVSVAGIDEYKNILNSNTQIIIKSILANKDKIIKLLKINDSKSKNDQFIQKSKTLIEEIKRNMSTIIEFLKNQSNPALIKNISDQSKSKINQLLKLYPELEQSNLNYNQQKTNTSLDNDKAKKHHEPRELSKDIIDNIKQEKSLVKIANKLDKVKNTFKKSNSQLLAQKASKNKSYTKEGVLLTQLKNIKGILKNTDSPLKKIIALHNFILSKKPRNQQILRQIMYQAMTEAHTNDLITELKKDSNIYHIIERPNWNTINQDEKEIVSSKDIPKKNQPKKTGPSTKKQPKKTDKVKKTPSKKTEILNNTKNIRTRLIRIRSPKNTRGEMFFPASYLTAWENINKTMNIYKLSQLEKTFNLLMRENTFLNQLRTYSGASKNLEYLFKNQRTTPGQKQSLETVKILFDQLNKNLFSSNKADIWIKREEDIKKLIRETSTKLHKAYSTIQRILDKVQKSK